MPQSSIGHRYFQCNKPNKQNRPSFLFRKTIHVYDRLYPVRNAAEALPSSVKNEIKDCRNQDLSKMLQSDGCINLPH